VDAFIICRQTLIKRPAFDDAPRGCAASLKAKHPVMFDLEPGLLLNLYKTAHCELTVDK
jgi:hypothetical protein